MKAADHAVTPGAIATGRALTLFRWSGRALFVAGGALSLYEVYHAENKAREVARQVGGWTAAISAGRYCAASGARIGAGIMTVAGQLGPQAAVPEELVTVPAGAFLGSAIGGIGCGVVGWFAGSEVSQTVYDWIFKPLEKEEWLILSE